MLRLRRQHARTKPYLKANKQRMIKKERAATYTHTHTEKSTLSADSLDIHRSYEYGEFVSQKGCG